jgi:glyoxylase-like metal-dependent hydrolase (beta-lactamase superfamily II)
MSHDHSLSRRTLLEAAALPFALSAEPVQILPGLRLIRGSVNTAVFERNGKRLMIDSGELSSVPAGGPVEWVLFTHYHRDQASAASSLARLGAKLAVPHSEVRLFAGIHEFWDSANSVIYHRYNHRPRLFALREPVPVTRALQGGDTLEWEGLRFEVIHTPGHTDGSLTYLVDISGKRVALTGDLICGPGQIWEIWSLQKALPGMRNDYTGFGGAAGDAMSSLDRILERKPDFLVPAHGVVMTDPIPATAQLRKNLNGLMNNFLSTAGWRVHSPGILPVDQPPMLAPLPEVSYPKWLRHVEYSTQAIVADDKSVFLFDCGSHKVLDKLAQMRAAGEIRAIEGVWITHYHDDHTSYVNDVRRRFGAEVYVQSRLVDIIENPTAYNMPCLYPESIHVDHVLEHGEATQWKEFSLTAYYFPGQTLYHAGLLIERDGYKVFVAGDSFINWGINPSCSENRCFLGRDRGYEDCLNLLLKVKPDMMVASHFGPVPLTGNYVTKTLAVLKERKGLCRKLFPHDDVNFGLDPYWIRAYPYRQAVLPGSRVALEARITNHSAKAMRVGATLNVPAGWQAVEPVGKTGKTMIPARGEGRIRLGAVSPRSPGRRRHVLGISIVADGTRLGEFAEAIVDFLEV